MTSSMHCDGEVLAVLKAASPRQRSVLLDRLQREGESAVAALGATLDCDVATDILIDVLQTLGRMRGWNAATVEAVVRKLNHRSKRVRLWAASALLHSSPRLRRFVPHLENLAERERDARVAEALRSILQRYRK